MLEPMGSALALALALVTLAACTAPISEERASFAAYRAALSGTADAPTLEPDSPEERAAIERYRAFYATYSPQAVRAGARGLYAEDAFFRDPFREVRGIDAVEAYLLHGAELIGECAIEIEDVARSDDDFYFRWIARVPAEDPAEPPAETIGLSHVRFDGEGKIVFQQDYLDPARAVYERIPVIGWILYKIRSRI
jgi:hypothetical protein